MKDRLREHLPIDRGWAWVIVIVCIGLLGLGSSVYTCGGIIQVELMERFPSASVSSLLWVIRLPLIITKLSGPLNGYLLTKVTHRTLSIAGVLMMSCSLIVFGYLPSVGYMYPVLGFGYGLGAGMQFFIAFTAYTDYFDRRKALAVGFIASGVGIGTMSLPLFLRFLFDNNSFPATMMLHSGLVLQLLILAALLRPISYYERIARWKVKLPVTEEAVNVEVNTIPVKVKDNLSDIKYTIGG